MLVYYKHIQDKTHNAEFKMYDQYTVFQDIITVYPKLT